MTLVVRRAQPEEILALRRAVLRPGLPVAASTYDQDPDAVHVGAWDDDALVGCGSVFPEPWPGPPPEPRAWRLRGMAVAPDRQGQGVGRAVLRTLTEAATAAGAPLLWANARTTALGFYAALGWRIAGEEFVTPDTGLPHFPIVRLCA